MRTSLVVTLAVAMSAARLSSQSTVARRDAALVRVVGQDDTTRALAGRGASYGVARDGRTYVFDRATNSLRIFSDGRSNSIAFGGAADGLRALGDATSIAVADQAVHVHRRSGDDALLSLEGVLIGNARPVRDATGVYHLRFGVTLVDVRPQIRSSVPRVNPMPAEPEREFLLLRATSGVTDTVASFPTDFTFLETAGNLNGLTYAPSGFGTQGAWALSGDSLLAIVDGVDGKVKWLGISEHGAILVRESQIRADDRRVTPDDVARRAATLAAGSAPAGGPAVSGAASVRQVTILNPPSRWSVATHAFYSCDGALWIGAPHVIANLATMTTTLENNTWTVVGPGLLTFVTELPSSFQLEAACGDYLIGKSWVAGRFLIQIFRLSTPR